MTEHQADDSMPVEVRRDGVTQYRFTEGDRVKKVNDALVYLHQAQGQSWNYALKYGGWSIVAIDAGGNAYCAVCDNPHPKPRMSFEK